MIRYHIKSVLFDMDGVLIDSNTEIENFWKEWALKQGFNLSPDDIVLHIHGRTTHDTISSLFQHANHNIKNSILESALAFDMNMRPFLIKGAGEFLKVLVSSLDKIAVVTSAPIARAKKMLELHDIYRCFTCSVTGDEVKEGKPHPEPYLKAAARLQVQPSDCLVFEDSNSGIRSALSAGMYVIAINNEEIKDERIITTIQNYNELSIQNNIIHIEGKNIQIALNNEKKKLS